MTKLIIHSEVIELSFLRISIAVFLIIAFTFLLVILLSRVVKTLSNKRKTALTDNLQRKINILVLYEKPKKIDSVFPWTFHLKNLRELIRKPGDKQLMIDLIIKNRQNLLGQSASVLRKIYIRLGLKRFSLSKLSSNLNLVKIKGLQELSQLECADVLPVLKKMFYSSNRKVRQEVFIAMVKIGGSMPFSLVTEYYEPIAGWMKVVIHNHLSALPADELPKFYEWMASSNQGVKIFALELIKQFQQLEAVPTLASLLNDEDQDLAVMAASVLGDLGIHQFADEIARLGWKNMQNETRTIRIIKSLRKIGNTNHSRFLAFQMIHGTYWARLEAIKALLKLKVSLPDQFIDFNIEQDGEFEELYNHATDPMLQ